MTHDKKRLHYLSRNFLRRILTFVAKLLLIERKALAFAGCQSAGYGCDGCGSGGMGVCFDYPNCTVTGRKACYELWICPDGTTYKTNESTQCCYDCEW